MYLPDGANGTEITYLDGTAEQIDKRLCWVLDDLLFHLRSSTEVLRRQSRMVLGRTARRVPLVLKQEFSLVPVKGREKIGEYDSQTGYVALRHIEKLSDGTDGTKVHFNSGVSVTVKDHIRVLAGKIRTTEKLSAQNEPQNK